MHIRIIKFPQICRKIPALLFLSFFFIFFTFNLLFEMVFPKSTERKLQSQLLNKPWDSKLHEQLGHYYLSYNLEKAEEEFLLADEFFLPENSDIQNSVLGIQTSPLSTWQNLIKKKEETVEQIDYWKNIDNKLPGYQYAKLAISASYIKLGDMEAAQYYLDQILRESPTNAMALKLFEKVKN